MRAPTSRVEGREKVTGAALYAADRHDLPELAHAVLIGSTIGKGRIVSIDAEAAKAVPGFLCLLTHENAMRFHPLPEDVTSSDKPGERRIPLQDNRVDHYGQHIALIVADALEHAQHAAALLKVQYKEERPAVRFEEGELYEPQAFFGQAEMKLQVNRGDCAAAMRSAPVSIERTYETPVYTHNAIELGSTIAAWDGERLTIYESTRWIKGVQRMVAQMLGLDQENVRVICPFIGGAFGSKGFFWGHIALAADAARRIGRPVKLVLTRHQMFTSIGRRPRTVQTIALAAERDAKLVATRHATASETAPYTDFVEPCGIITRSLYACPNLEVRHRVLRLNMSPPIFTRAPGEATGMFALESAMDELAEELGVDPVELRVRNHTDVDQNRGKPYSSKHLLECYRVGAERFGWAKRNPHCGSMRDGDALIGWGMATSAYPARRPPASAKATLFEDGTLLVTSATHDVGGGTYTVMEEIAARTLGIPIERVRFELGDSSFPTAPVSGGSWTAMSVGAAVVAAVTELKKKIAALAPEHGRPPTPMVCPTGLEKIEAEAEAKPGEEREKYSFESFGAVFVEVAIRETAPVRVRRITGVYDVGTVLNPKLARSQICGGLIWGMGMALTEHTIYDPRWASPVNANLADYEVVTSADIPEFDIDFLDKPDPYVDPMGARGLGEIPITGVAAAIATAVYHATGRRVRELPITADKLL